MFYVYTWDGCGFWYLEATVTTESEAREYLDYFRGSRRACYTNYPVVG